MEYFIYKDEKDKKAIIDEMKRIRKYIYDDEDISCLDKSIKLISYSKVKSDRNLIKQINGSVGGICRRGSDYYFRCYGDRSEYALSSYKETIMIHMMFYNSGSENDLVLSIFYPYIYAYYVNGYLGKKEEIGVNEELAHLGVLAFANEYDPYKNNSLIICALHYRNYIKRLFEEMVGLGSFDEFAERCKSFSEHQNKGTSVAAKILDEDFTSIIESLKMVFDARMGEIPESILSEDEKSAMIDNFYEVYGLLKEKYKNEKDSLTKVFTGL